MKSGVCPNCGHERKAYRRRIGKEQVMLLRRLASQSGPTKLRHIKGVNPSNYPDFCRLRYWGLIKEVGNGFWATTYTGLLWLDGEIGEREFVWTMNGRVIYELDGENLDQGRVLFVHDIEGSAGKPEVKRKGRTIQQPDLFTGGI